MQTFSRVYVLWMWPTFANRAMQSFLRAQGVVRPVSIITTVTLANGNPLLLGQFTAGAILNAVLLVQSLVWD